MKVMTQHNTAESASREDNLEYFHKQRMGLYLFPSVVQHSNSGLVRVIVQVPRSHTNKHNP